MTIREIIVIRQSEKRQKKIKEILSTRCRYCRKTNIVKDCELTKKLRICKFYCLECKQKWKIKLKR